MYWKKEREERERRILEAQGFIVYPKDKPKAGDKYYWRGTEISILHPILYSKYREDFKKRNGLLVE